jgi:short subunit dehydrogenase-like uncharacterized protein
MTSGWVLIYGSNGYTDRLIVDRALDRGFRPVLAGRNADEVQRQADGVGPTEGVAR